MLTKTTRWLISAMLYCPTLSVVAQTVEYSCKTADLKGIPLFGPTTLDYVAGGAFTMSLDQTGWITPATADPLSVELLRKAPSFKITSAVIETSLTNNQFQSINLTTDGPRFAGNNLFRADVIPGSLPSATMTANSGIPRNTWAQVVAYVNSVGGDQLAWVAHLNGGDSYNIYDQSIIIDGNMHIPWGVTFNDKWVAANLPYGNQTLDRPVRVVCSRTILQLTINVDPIINFGNVLGGATVLRPFNITVTSGTDDVKGTIKFESDATKPNGRVNLGGGEVRITDPTSNTEYAMGVEVPINGRTASFNAVLDPTGAPPGQAESHLTVTMTVN